MANQILIIYRRYKCDERKRENEMKTTEKKLGRLDIRRIDDFETEPSPREKKENISAATLQIRVLNPNLSFHFNAFILHTNDERNAEKNKNLVTKRQKS